MHASKKFPDLELEKELDFVHAPLKRPPKSDISFALNYIMQLVNGMHEDKSVPFSKKLTNITENAIESKKTSIMRFCQLYNCILAKNLQ